MAGHGGISVQVGADFGNLRRCKVDWFGQDIDPPVEFGFLLDNDLLTFRTQREAPASCHPDSSPGEFREELWKYDVAEFFLSHPENGTYLEVNLAPNGAWWTCLFRAPREPLGQPGEMITGVTTTAEITGEFWSANLSIPLEVLGSLPVGFGEGWGLNTSFILNSPKQRFVSAVDLGGGEPDFHQPAKFLPLEIR